MQKMNFSEYFKDGFVIGYVVSAGFVTASLMSYYYLIWLNLKLKQRRNRAKVCPLRNHIQRKKTHVHDQVSKLSLEISKLQRWVTQMSYEEISRATNSFSKDNIIGLGRMGTTYKAILQNGCLLAVKRLHGSQQHLEKRFICEVKSIARLRHNNLVPLLGFCIEGRERILVNKYMPSGNLYDWLHPKEEKAIAMTMEWDLRLKIAVGVARGLAWLHHHRSFRLAHLDITSSSILLEHNFEPKMSNFSRAILMNQNDPDSSGSWELGFIKSDVYSFGIVLLELITLKERSQMTASSSGTTDEKSLVEWITHLLSGISDNSIDKSLREQALEYEILKVLRIARNCAQPDCDQRPSMFQVYKKLRAVGERYGHHLTYDSGMSKPPEIVTPNAQHTTTTLEIVEIQ